MEPAAAEHLPTVEHLTDLVRHGDSDLDTSVRTCLIEAGIDVARAVVADFVPAGGGLEEGDTESHHMVVVDQDRRAWMLNITRSRTRSEIVRRRELPTAFVPDDEHMATVLRMKANRWRDPDVVDVIYNKAIEAALAVFDAGR